MSRAFRYHLILVLVGLGTTAAAVAGWRFARASAPVSGPIVLVSIDSLRADHLPAYGYRKVATPALDALAADGLVFEHAYAHTPLTLPAHASLLSGRLPTETGVHDDLAAPLPDSLRLVSSLLGDRGYATGGIVSSYALRRSTGLSRGFAFFDDELQPVRREGGSLLSEALAESAGDAVTVRRDGAESEKRAERWLSGVGTTRAFLFLHLDEPHAPYDPPAPYAHFGPYDGDVAYADDLVGRLVAYLKKQQLYDESTIIVVGDHGESLGAHGESEHGLLVLDDTIRVPLIIKQAGSEGAGRRIVELVQQVDLVPTILDLVNAPMPGGLPGRSLRPLIAGATLGPRTAYAESRFAQNQYGWPVMRTVTDGRYRYVSSPAPALFDLERDPESRTDVSASHPDEATRLAAVLARFEKAEQANRERGERSERTAERPEHAERDARDRATHGDTLSDADAGWMAMLKLGAIGPKTFANLPGTTVGDTHDQGAVATDDLPENAGAIVAAYRRAMTAYAEKRWTPAIEQLRELARTSPARADMWASLALVADRAQRYDVAADAWRRLLATAPGGDVTDARLNLTWTLLRARRLDEARAQGELALAAATVGAARVRAHELLARIAVARRDAVAARALAQELAELDPSSPAPAFVEGRLLFERAHYDEALAQFDQATTTLAKDRAMFDLEFWRGETLVKLARGPEAEEAYLDELRHFADNARAFTSLATLYHAQGRADEADALVARYTRTVRTTDAFDAAARLWTSFGDRQRADAVRREGLRLLAATAAALTQ